MSTMPSKVNVQIAVPNKSRKVFSQDHLTTHSFMRPRPIFAREYIPGRNMQVNVDSFLRVNPMPVPIFGHAKVHNRAFFVPFRCVMPDWNEFYTSTIFNYSNPVTNSIPSSVPVFRNDDVVKFFVQSVSGSNPLLVPPSVGGVSDITVVQNNTPTQYCFTVEGIHVYSVLESLGYRINWNMSDTFRHSALPLLCYAKVLIDWYYPSAYVGSSVYNFIQSIFNTAVDGRVIDQTLLGSIFEMMRYSAYNPDYYVNAWDSPVGPNGGVERSITLDDITDPASDIGAYVDNQSIASLTPSANNTDNGFTQYVVDALKALTDYTKRHQLSGVRALDRYLSELGISLSDEILKRSMYLGSQSFDMEFYDVFSHSDTYDSQSNSGQPLGAYAGKGNGYSGSKTFDFENGQEFGMFIIVNTVVPQIGYYQGQHRETMHVNCLDFYHGDFDHMAVQPISGREVFMTQNGSLNVSQASINQTIFGYAPKYIEYNTPMDCQSGLYRIKSRQGLLPCYSLMRDLSYYETGNINQIKHNVGFVLGNDSGQYNRITFDAKSLEDCINAIHHFDVTYIDSTLPAYDTYDFDEANGNITLDVNGSKLN